MSLSLINVDLPIEQTIGVLKTMSDVRFNDIPGGLSLAQGDVAVASETPVPTRVPTSVSQTEPTRSARSSMSIWWPTLRPRLRCG